MNFPGPRFPVLLLVLLSGVAVWSCIGAADAQVWQAETLSVAAVVVPLALTYRLFRFSNMAYAIISLWAFMHLIGAHYTFELVPFDAVNDLFGWERNQYDRVAHFCIGISSFAMAEFVWRRDWVRSVMVAALFGQLGIMALANAWELVEWIYAVWDGGDAGLAFLGSQGDIWDAQKDMLMDTLGGLLGGLLFLIFGKSTRSSLPTRTAICN